MRSSTEQVRPELTASPGRRYGPHVQRTLDELLRLEREASTAERTDLVARIADIRSGLAEMVVPVAVVGEFKQGKSTLVNALLKTDVCPVDPDIGTAVPTVVRYGSPARALGVLDGAGAGAHVELAFDELAEAATERRLSGAPELRSVEVRLDRPLLATGLSFVDTPGLGGRDSAHGIAALAALSLARGALFLTDAGQEFTVPELDYLRQVVERCPYVIVVLTKIDLHGQWRRILELDRAHLARAGLDVPVLGVSSLLRMHATVTRSEQDLHRSGVPALLTALLGPVLRPADVAAAQAVDADLDFVSEQLRARVVVEREVLRSAPEQVEQVVAQLVETVERSRPLTSPSAGWHVLLSDGVQDLVADVEHDLRQRLLALLRAGEARIDDGDPAEDWGEFDSWLQAEAAAAAVANLHVLVARADQLAQEVAERFALDCGELDFDLPMPSLALSRVTSPRVRFTGASSRRLVGLLAAARLSYGGAVVAGAAANMVGQLLLTVAAPVGIALFAALAHRMATERRRQEVQQRRAEAKQELRRYVDEVGFVLGKDSRDAVRHTQRQLRDEFTDRARIVQRSSADALAAAQRARGTAPDVRAARAVELDEQERRLAVGSTPVGDRS